MVAVCVCVYGNLQNVKTMFLFVSYGIFNPLSYLIVLYLCFKCNSDYVSCESLFGLG